MALDFGIDLYIDNTLIDCDDYGNVNIGVGDFSPINPGAPHRATLDIYADWGSVLSEGTLLTIVMTGPDPGTTAPTGVYDSGSAWEYCLFSGTVASRQGNGPSIHKSTTIGTAWVGDDSNIFNQKLSMGSDTPVGHAGMIINAATDLGLPTTGTLGFCDNTFLEMFQPAQTGSVGAFLQKAGAGSGTWTTCEWDWDGSAADFVWRPTYFNETHADSLARQLTPTIRHMWLLDWRDVGVVFDDYFYRVRVEGRNSAAVDKSGSDVGGMPAESGNRTVIVDTFIDNDPDCATAATHLVFRLKDPIQQKVYNVTAHLDLYRDSLVGQDDSADVYNATEALLPAWEWAYARPGDVIQWFAPTGSSITWPAAADALETQFMACIDGDIDEASNFSLVTGATWELDPHPRLVVRQVTHEIPMTSGPPDVNTTWRRTVVKRRQDRANQVCWFRGFKCRRKDRAFVLTLENTIGSIRIFQMIGTVAASAGTHSEGGCIDYAPITVTYKRAVMRDRDLGGTGWHRTQAQGFDEHIHTYILGAGYAAAGARAQGKDYLAGGDGLGTLTGGDDPDKYRPKPQTMFSYADYRKQHRVTEKIADITTSIGRLRRRLKLVRRQKRTPVRRLT